MITGRGNQPLAQFVAKLRTIGKTSAEDLGVESLLANVPRNLEVDVWQAHKVGTFVRVRPGKHGAYTL
jgi:hypothetical protein